MHDTPKKRKGLGAHLNPLRTDVIIFVLNLSKIFIICRTVNKLLSLSIGHEIATKECLIYNLKI